MLAMRVCTGCHVVTPDQPFKPVYAPPPYPPDFKEIANRSNVTAASLRHHLETLPATPKQCEHAESDAVDAGNTRHRRIHHQSARQAGGAQVMDCGGMRL